MVGWKNLGNGTIYRRFCFSLFLTFTVVCSFACSSVRSFVRPMERMLLETDKQKTFKHLNGVCLFIYSYFQAAKKKWISVDCFVIDSNFGVFFFCSFVFHHIIHFFGNFTNRSQSRSVELDWNLFLFILVATVNVLKYA